MPTTTAATCRVVIADRGMHRFGLVQRLTEAGFAVTEVAEPMHDLRDLGLMELEVLLEVHAAGRGLGNFFPQTLSLQAWNAFLCVVEGCLQPTLVMTRKNAYDPAGALAANQELVALLQQSVPLSCGVPGIVATHVPATCRDTVADVVSPLAAPSQTRLAGLACEIAHDLNNLLAIIRGHCQLLTSAAPRCDTGHKLVDEIDRAGEQAALITGHLVAASRSEEIPAEVQDLHAVLTDCAGMLQSLLGNRIELILRLDPHPCRLRLVPGQIERVLVNLTANARNAMPNGGTLTITTALLDFEPPMPVAGTMIAGPHVLLTVTDTGSGFDKRARLFQPPTTKPRTQGLGLSIVAQVVRQHGGHIELSPMSTTGASLQIFLPLAQAAARQQPAADTILLVEDEAMVRSIFRRILQDHGYFILEAASGCEALLLAKQFTQPIRLLVTDMAMPRMNGTELAKRLASVHAETGVLFLSGYAKGSAPCTSAPDGTFAFLQKPFTADTLAQKVRELLDH